MHTPDTLRKLMGWSFCGGILLAALAGCEPKAAGEAPPKTGTATESGPIGTATLGSADVVGGVLFGPNGEFVVVDARGNKVAPCRLPDADRNADAPADAGECQKVRNTTITDLQSIGGVRHTGSHCLIVGPVQTVSAGGVVSSSGVFQLPPGCTH